MSRYTVIKTVGKGTFGMVYEAEEYGTGRIVAVKKVFQDKNYKVLHLCYCVIYRIVSCQL